ncbi:acyl-CoA dehydrogenase [Saccharopolyspora sp. HNM0983]|uniref:3-methylmercaptopropionyl-CoA dehydrogenase n=1 Tax=Saccharopolyspora montiporae TaxID=2781240 RepID=A0A929BCM6_9PSEU|nr:acyl-CoA dehydrogenase [Saccharopolyspora sp. HNM0983]MBE9376335.1 acyl-CoA dehydrogenase [Saccharopolyspora sp. HNM0983]
MYRAPASDYDFLLRYVIDGAGILKATTDDEVTLDDVTDVLGHAGTLAADLLAPLNAPGDRVGSKLENDGVTTPPGFTEAYKTFAEGGWTSLGVPASIGGGGMPRIVANAAGEFWSAANTAFSLCPGLSQGAIAACHAHARDELRQTYVPPLVSGRWTGTMNLTEPQAGTDLAAIRTSAQALDDGAWSITGQKIFITWGDHDLAENIVHLVLARTPDAPTGLGGLSLFLVPKYLPDPDGRPGERNRVQTVSLEHKLGIHASPTCVLDYENATGFLVGQQNQGLAAMFVMMNQARLGIAVQGIGLADRAYQQAHAYAAERVQGRVTGRPAGTPIAEHPDVRRLLLSMSSAISAMRGLSTQVSAWIDRANTGHAEAHDADLVEFFVPIIKGWASEACVQITSDAVQVHGGMGFIEETGAAQYYRDARILPIYEGTTAIQANDLLGRKLLRDNGATAETALALIEASVATARAAEHPVAHRLADRLAAAVEAVRHSTRTILARADSPRDAFAGGVSYLQQWGLLAGGWMHARMLVAALGAAEDSASPRRIREADGFATAHLSQVHSLGESITAGEIA